jgi:hypothetical protein
MKKRININFYRICEVADETIATLADKFSLMLSHAPFGFFETSKREIMFKLYASFDLNGSEAYLFGLIRENENHPVFFDREGTVGDVPLANGGLGSVTYGLVVPEKRLLVTTSGGCSKSVFNDFLRWTVDKAPLEIQHIYMDDALNKVMNWDVFRKLEISVKCPTSDFADDVLNTDSGRELSQLLTVVEGLSMTTTVSMGTTKGSMSGHVVKKYIQTLLEDGYAEKIAVTGKTFEDEKSETIDLIASKLKCAIEIKISGAYLQPEEARATLLEGLYNNQQYI